MDAANLLFIIAFIGLPLAIGIWALVMRRELLRRGGPVSRRRRTAPPRRPAQQARTAPATERGHTADQTTQVGAQEGAEQETAAVPRRDWASAVKPVRGQTGSTHVPARRHFYPPRYAGRSGGVVKRVTPRAAQSFLRPRSAVPR